MIGPCEVRPLNPTVALQGNPELFVNVGPQGTIFTVSDSVTGQNLPSATGDSPLARAYLDSSGNPFLKTVQFLILVNGVDDDGDGYTDNGWNGADENLNGTPDDLLEWFKLQPANDGPSSHPRNKKTGSAR